MKLIVFSKSYFEGKVEVRDHDTLRKLLDDNRDCPIRIQDVHGRRILLHPAENDGLREIDGTNDIVWCVKLFKDYIGHVTILQNKRANS